MLRLDQQAVGLWTSQHDAYLHHDGLLSCCLCHTAHTADRGRRTFKLVVFIRKHLIRWRTIYSHHMVATPLAWFLHPTRGEFHLEIDRALNHGFENTVLQESEPPPPVRGLKDSTEGANSHDRSGSCTAKLSCRLKRGAPASASTEGATHDSCGISQVPIQRERRHDST